MDSVSNFEVTDLLGKGTAALVWSTALPARAGAHVAYIDLMPAGKPYLLATASNNLAVGSHVVPTAGSRREL